MKDIPKKNYNIKITATGNQEILNNNILKEDDRIRTVIKSK